MKKVCAVIQARMASKRLPDKVMKSILGKPIIWHIFNRLIYARRADHIIIATSVNKENNIIRDFAKRSHIPCFSGSEEDLLQRLSGAVSTCNADVMVRVTADCPLVDPVVLDNMVGYFLNKGDLDYLCNNNPPSFPHGLDLDIISTKALFRLGKEVKDDYKREWFISNLKDQPNRYNIANFTNDKDLSSLRWIVDYPDDLKLVRLIYRALFKEDGIFLMGDILKLLSRRSKLQDINEKHNERGDRDAKSLHNR